jgi:mono/diheme cytochrome c family protein
MRLTVAVFLIIYSLILIDAGFARFGQAQMIKVSDSAVVSSEARAAAGDLYRDRCATCHGDEGRGDGPGSANLTTKPIDFHNKTWQKTVSDKNIAKAIVYGGRAVGMSGQMAANPDLENQPAVVAALVEKIRKWKD